MGCSILTVTLWEKPHNIVPIECDAKDLCKTAHNADCWNGQPTDLKTNGRELKSK